jgi:excinuclease ABC subunit B
MRETVTETERRRAIQQEYNENHSITPRSIEKAIRDARPGSPSADYVDIVSIGEENVGTEGAEALVEELRAEMLGAAANLDFERAAMLRDRIMALKKEPSPGPRTRKRKGKKRARR